MRDVRCVHDAKWRPLLREFDELEPLDAGRPRRAQAGSDDLAASRSTLSCRSRMERRSHSFTVRETDARRLCSIRGVRLKKNQGRGE